MRLTSQVITNAPVVLNPEGQLTLQLRNLQIPYIENLGITHDKYSVIDLTNNEIVELGNIPSNFVNLEVLLLANNNIAYIDDEFPEENRLRTLSLINNNISRLSLRACQRFKSLENLALQGNPICEREQYRLFVIWLVPSIKILDFKKVKQAEHESAKELFGISHEEVSELALTYLGSATKPTGTSQSKIDDGSASTTDKKLTSVGRKLTESEKQDLLEKLAAAESLDEIEAIELTLKQGVV